MNSKALSLLGALVLTGTTAQAADFYLCAGAATQTMPDGAVVTVWGFAQDDNANLADGCGTGVVQVPGPALNVAAADAGPLNINVLNNLPVSVSVVIPGQNATTMTPVYFTDGQLRQRVRSFTHETAPAAIGVYTWTSVAAGTYAYQSGTHPAQQVQMGLYGALTKNAVDAGVGTAAQIYPGVAYDTAVTVFYSEVDPAVHTAQALNPAAPITVNYTPQYFLVNGLDGLSKVVAGAAGQRTLVRFINMGLKTHAPMFKGLYMSVVAEDGKAYAYAKEQYSLTLGAGTTADAIITPAASGNYALLDRMLYLTSRFDPAQATVLQNPGGMISLLAVAAPVADADGDGVADNLDNCTLVANSNQRDTNGDGFGNICDADLDNSGGPVNTADYLIFRRAFGTPNADADFNGNGIVNTADYNIFRRLIGNPAGPSGVVP